MSVVLRNFQEAVRLGAINIPLGDIQNHALKLKRQNKPIITCCRSGARSGSAAVTLKNVGIEVYNEGVGILQVYYYAAKRIAFHIGRCKRWRDKLPNERLFKEEQQSELFTNAITTEELGPNLKRCEKKAKMTSPQNK